MTDDPVVLPVVGEVAAGQARTASAAPGTAMKIMTGAPVPDGADAIVPYENTDRGADDVRSRCRARSDSTSAGSVRTSRPARHVPRGRSARPPRTSACWPRSGVDKVMVRPRPRVVVVSTGSELVDPGRPLASEHQIYDSNSYLLAAAAGRRRPGVPGRPGRRRSGAGQGQLINDQLVRADLILTTGGVSQGDYDIVKAVMPELGATDFAAVAMQPGKPQGFGLIGEDGVPMIMLPGNPVSAFVSFEAFVRPVIRKLMGVHAVRPDRGPLPGRPRDDARSRADASSPAGIVSVDDDGDRQVSLVGGHGSHLLGDLARANALVDAARGRPIWSAAAASRSRSGC